MGCIRNVSAFLLICFVCIEAFSFPAEIQKYVDDLVYKKKFSSGMAVAVISPNGTSHHLVGTLSRNSKKAVTSRTLFRIGSITKTMVGVLTQDYSDRKVVDLNAPISKYLPSHVNSPKFNGKEITLLHLATHTSGLPAFPSIEGDPLHFTLDKFYSWLSSYNLTREPGTVWEYSNAGIALQAHVVAEAAKRPWDQLFRSAFLIPLGLRDTVPALRLRDSLRLAQGTSEDGSPAPRFELGSVGPAGNLFSSLEDLIIYMQYNLGLKNTRLYPAMQRSHQQRTGRLNLGGQALGWMIEKGYVFHFGVAPGYRAGAAFHPETKKALIILANADADLKTEFWKVIEMVERASL